MKTQQLPPELVEKIQKALRKIDSKNYVSDKLNKDSRCIAQIAVEYADEIISKALKHEKECAKLAKMHLIGEERVIELTKHNYAISMLQQLLKKHEDGK